jgi:CHAT domain
VRAADAAGAALSQVLIAPAAALLGTKRLLIVGEGVLQYVPFGALPVASRQLSIVRKTTTTNQQLITDNRQPLIADHEIITLPSASTLAVLRSGLAARPPAPQTIAILADPVFDNAPTGIHQKRQSEGISCGCHLRAQKPTPFWQSRPNHKRKLR